jgi:hypothetical protein
VRRHSGLDDLSKISDILARKLSSTDSKHVFLSARERFYFKADALRSRENFRAAFGRVCRLRML